MDKQVLDQKIATILDAQFRIPGTPIRFGWDALLGLVPIAGDSLAAIFSLYFVIRGIQEKLPLRVLLIMVGNIMLEWLIGSIPILGDTFDVLFKTNMRNLALLQRFTRK